MCRDKEVEEIEKQPTEANLFRSYEVAERYEIPKPTMANWSKAYGTWRHRLYRQLEKAYARELAEKASELE